MGDVTDLPLSETAKRRVRRARAAAAASGRWVSDEELARIRTDMFRVAMLAAGLKLPLVLKLIKR
jgi:hypothetical protein